MPPDAVGGAAVASGRPASPPGVLRAALVIAHKDVVVELRARSTILSALTFAVLGVSVFFFAWDPTAVAATDLAPGVLWVIFTFSSLLGLHRSFGGEQVTRGIDALVAAPVEREAIFLGKALANLAFVAVVQLVTVPAVALLYNVPLTPIALPLTGLVLAAAIGVVTVGTLFSAMAINTRLAELLLPVLALPFFVPIIISAAQATSTLLAGRPVAEVAGYLRLLVAFDAVALVVSTFMYPSLIEQ